MKLSDQSIKRIARHLLSQQEALQPPQEEQVADYGDGNPTEVQSRLEASGAYWTDQGWVADTSVNLSNCGLTRLPPFASVNGGFSCYYNYLTSLVGSPPEVTGNFDCSNNQLTSLEGAPSYVGGSFNCNNNQLTTLQGVPQYISNGLRCKGNPLTSLDGVGKVYGPIVSDLQ